MPKFVLDGKEIEFAQGQTIIEAAKEHGTTIPHFCWHPKLSVSGNCRVCLVEVEKMPKLVIACATFAAEGMVVNTYSGKAVSARNAVMEFLLINHPLDCPICDEAGECKLQDYAYQHSQGESRFVEEKVHKDKRVPLGPLVMFDAERCISCSRCIRFCEEIAKDPELTFVQRGDHVTIVTYPGEQMDNPYSLNTTDICPVGALTNRDFRFKARVWDMSSTESVCNGCSRGCNMEIWVRNNEVLRLTPRYNEAVNSYWMCDHGRVNTFKFINQEDRVTGPYIRREGALTPVNWEEAYTEAALKLQNYPKEQLAFIGSPYATVEDNYLFAKLARSLGVKNISYMPHIDPSFADDILRREDMTPNSLGAELVAIGSSKDTLGINAILDGINSGKIKALYLLEDDLVKDNPELENVLAKLDLFIMNSTNLNSTAKLADILFPASTYAEKNGTLVNFQGRVQRIKPAVATNELDRALDGLSLSRLDKFGTEFDRWAKKNRHDSKPGWKIIAGIANTMSIAGGLKMKYNMAEEVFDEIAGTVNAFKDMDYDVIGDQGAELKIAVTEKV